MAMLGTLARAQRDEGHLGDALATYETLLSEVASGLRRRQSNRRVFESEAALARMDRGDLDEVATRCAPPTRASTATSASRTRRRSAR
jgi:hypothetical protein